MGDLKLQGYSGMFHKEVPVEHRKLPDGYPDKDIKGLMQNNNLDEIAVASPDGQKHIVYADELKVKGGHLPKVGEQVNLPFLDDPATVIAVDDEFNEDYGFAAMTAAGGLAGLGIAGLADVATHGGGVHGDAAAIRLHTTDDEVSQKELKWAEAFSARTAKGGKIDKTEQARHDDIVKRHHQQQAIDKQPYPDCPSLTAGDIKWAVRLEKKVLHGLTPTRQETKRYMDIADTLRKGFEQKDVEKTLPPETPPQPKTQSETPPQPPRRKTE